MIDNDKDNLGEVNQESLTENNQTLSEDNLGDGFSAFAENNTKITDKENGYNFSYSYSQKTDMEYDNQNLYTNTDLVMTNEDILNATTKTSSLKKIFKLVGNVILDVAFICMIIVLIANVGFNQTYEIANVQGKSMLSTFDETGDAVCYKKINNYTYGDVIVYQRTTGTKVIKRVIALAGDKIRIDYDEASNSYKVFLNNEVLEEDYLDPDYSNMQREYIRFRELKTNDIGGSAKYFDTEGNLVVPEGYIFYMGDNRTNSSDCVEYGPQIVENILGKVFFTYPSTWTENEVKMTEIRIILFYGNLFNNFAPNFNM